MNSKNTESHNNNHDAPGFRINAQYLKDLSLESPLSPGILVTSTDELPKVNIDFNVLTKRLSDEKVKTEQNTFVEHYEVVLQVKANADLKKEKPAFLCELDYGALVSVETVDESDKYNESIKSVLMTRIPHIIFPFVREIIARVVSSAGFPPLMLEPVDFEGQHVKNEEEKQKKDGNNS